MAELGLAFDWERDASPLLLSECPSRIDPNRALLVIQACVRPSAPVDCARVCRVRGDVLFDAVNVMLLSKEKQRDSLHSDARVGAMSVNDAPSTEISQIVYHCNVCMVRSLSTTRND